MYAVVVSTKVVERIESDMIFEKFCSAFGFNWIHPSGPCYMQKMYDFFSFSGIQEQQCECQDVPNGTNSKNRCNGRCGHYRHALLRNSSLSLVELTAGLPISTTTNYCYPIIGP